MASHRSPADEPLGREVWVVAGVVILGVVMSILDTTIVNVAIDNQDTPTVFNVFQFLGTVTNMYIKDSVFTGPSRWRVDAGFTATDVVLEDVVFTTSNPGTAPGVYYI